MYGALRVTKIKVVFTNRRARNLTRTAACATFSNICFRYKPGLGYKCCYIRGLGDTHTRHRRPWYYRTWHWHQRHRRSQRVHNGVRVCRCRRLCRGCGLQAHAVRVPQERAVLTASSLCHRYLQRHDICAAAACGRRARHWVLSRVGRRVCLQDGRRRGAVLL